MVLRLFHGLGSQRPDAEARARLGMARARPVLLLVELDGALAAGAVAEEPGVAVGQAEQGGDLGAVVGAAEDPDLWRGIALRESFYGGEGMAIDEGFAMDPGDQIADIGGKVFGPLVGCRIEGKGGAAVGARGAAQSHVDAAGRQRIEHAEDLGHFERRVVRQHDAGAADADAIGGGGDGRDHDLGRRADDGRMVVMLGNPEAFVAQRLAMLGKRHGVADRLVLGAVGDGDRLIENGKTHTQQMACLG